MKRLLSTKSLITHMKEKGIHFDIINEQEAMHFLSEHNYYFKLASYRKNYDKGPFGKKQGQYINLDFAYLKDLSTIDFKLRYLILQMCLDIEHSLKSTILHDMETNPNEDGYKIVSLWDASLSYRAKVNRYVKNSYSHNLGKYNPEYPAWVLFELISFGELCKFVDCYNSNYPKRLPFDAKALYPIRDIRNAAAYNACLINNVREDYRRQPNATLLKFLQSHNVPKRIRVSKLSNKPIHDFCCLLLLYPQIVKSEFLRKDRKRDLLKIFQRMRRHANYYTKNKAITTTFEFVLKMFFLIKSCY